MWNGRDLQWSKEVKCMGKTENDVWCTEQVPVEYIVEEIYQIV